MGSVSSNENISFLIIEPTIGIPEVFIKESIDAENTKSRVKSQSKIGEYILQERYKLK